MKRFIKHCLNDHFEDVMKWSVRNCHVEGLHSIVFSKTPMIRLFFATKDHLLWKNTLDKNGKDMSVAFHPHHCDITLATELGMPFNWVVAEGDSMEVSEFFYQSKLTGKTPSFEFLANKRLSTLRSTPIGEMQEMKASTLHTIYVPKGDEAAWWVFEGKENPDYCPVAYSADDLEKFDFSPLYKPMTDMTLYRMVTRLGVNL